MAHWVQWFTSSFTDDFNSTLMHTETIYQRVSHRIHNHKKEEQLFPSKATLVRMNIFIPRLSWDSTPQKTHTPHDPWRPARTTLAPCWAASARLRGPGWRGRCQCRCVCDAAEPAAAFGGCKKVGKVAGSQTKVVDLYTNIAIENGNL